MALGAGAALRNAEQTLVLIIDEDSSERELPSLRALLPHSLSSSNSIHPYC